MNGRPGESPADLIGKLRAEYVTTPRDLSFLDHLGRVLQRGPDQQLTLEPTRFGSQRATRGIIVPAPSSVRAAGVSSTPATRRGSLLRSLA